MNSAPIIDLHCDLLGCIEFAKGLYSFNSPEVRCSLPQLEAGGVQLQTLAVAAVTEKGSSLTGKGQIEIYKKLKELSFKPKFILAIENGSAIIEEDENLDLFFKRFEEYSLVERILYISLTWNHENRFGGGNVSDTGLKKDGEILLEYLSGKNVAIDFSHTSDKLAYDLLNTIQKKSLDIPILASHSNYRTIHDVPRNLPDEIAKEIIRKKGLIGLNFIHRFIGKSPDVFIQHVEHALILGGEDAIAFGADFYGGLDAFIPKDLCPGRTKVTFFEEFQNSGCYPEFIAFLGKYFPKKLIDKISFQNAEKFLKELYAKAPI